ncbi:hypothetical protein LB518_23110 [Mesorhizobium sp. BR1-1-16]|uniref:hypothetical protein n=1 Tax=Mesorhizobium sp. BR1-1-16 TaxID=2876653 RepID=UPI001CC9708C|nr:hypothetical protein [Mesorhizobium sp. BR1-1-16]MBZ9939205.1 hypothetical protein [Mesorhizobium sp. BR1-1-16]
MDDALFQKLLADTVANNPPPAAKQGDEASSQAIADAVQSIEAGAAQPASAATPAEAQAPPPAAPSADPNAQPSSPTPQTLNPLGHVSEAIQSIGGGAGNAVLETKDFLFGEPPEADKSAWRKDFESTNRQLQADSPVNGFIMGVSQFATGLIGAGKFLKGAQLAVPALEAAGGAIARAGGVVRGAAEAVKAATVGSIVFDPHDARLSNLIESFPALSNPITGWLAADPTDTAAEGRLKSAIESIGLDAALGAVLVGATKAYKALASGDHVAAEAAARETEAAVNLRTNPPPANASPEEVAALNAKIAAEVKAGTFGKDATNGNYSVPPVAGVGGGPLPHAETAGGVANPIGATFTAVPNATEAAAQDGTKLPPRLKLPEITDDQINGLLSGIRSDAEAIDKAGSWQGAIQDGHTFGVGEKVPWQKLDPQDDPSGGTTDFTARLADSIEAEVNKAKGGDVLSDARVQQMVQQRANLFGEDPAALLGMIQQSGKAASRMVADMEAGYLVSQRAFQDSFAMASRINAGVLDEWGGDLTKALDGLKKQVSISAAAYSGARSITANAGRALRRMRGEFRLKPEDIQALTEVDGERLAQLIANTMGDPKALAKIATPSTWAKIADWANFLQVNNLLWGWKTHLVNISTNGYMLAARPAERIVGSFAVQGGQAIRSEAMRQYLYMGTALGDSFRAAREAFVLGDSRLAPHGSEVLQAGLQGKRQGANALNFKPWGSLPNLVHNVLVVSTPKTLIGLPTRSLGFADEMMKQITYRSKVLAKAHVDGMERGLEGKALRDFIGQKLDDAFDDNGVGLDAQAKREAQIATFQQDLLAKTFGKAVQDGTAQLPALRIVLPFVKTPTNVLRYGWKMTPGLNLLQSEYRQMITGKLGEEARAQAVGQMGLGTLFMGALAFKASQGTITSGGPSDPKLRSALLATGWQPYSFVNRHDDGTTTYTPFGKFDPVAMPMGIVADLADAIHIAEETGDADLMGRVENGTTALLVSVAKQMGNKSYLMNVGALLDALDQPDSRMAGFMGRTASNFVPAASLLRTVNPDPYLRDARGVVDRIIATVPGLSEHLPARYDAWGEPITARKGLSSTMESDLVDREVERQVLEGGSTFAPPSARIKGGVDLRDITLKDGRNAYEVYQQLAGKPGPNVRSLKQVVAKAITSPVYAKAPDGPAEIKGTKLWLLSGFVVRYRNAALAVLKMDPNVRAAMLKERLKVQGAYATKQADPTGARAQGGSLAEVGKAFGVDLSGLTK